jgi:copper oxidase (laccase) domain-containing protein
MEQSFKGSKNMFDSHMISGIKSSWSFGGGSLSIIGRQPRIIDKPAQAEGHARLYGADPEKIALLIVASAAGVDGHKDIVHDTYSTIKFADGVVLSEAGGAGIIQTADCAALALHDKASGKMVLAHAGRPALTPDDHCPTCTITYNALCHLVGSTGDKSQVEALVVGNICGSCFKHDQPEAKHLVEPFMKYPPQVFTNTEAGALDLYEVIKHELVHHGVPVANIGHVGSCTFETDSLSSHRRGDTDRNTVVLVRHR